MVCAGAWHWRAARCRGSRATGGSGAARPDKAPFISYMKGASVFLPDGGASARSDTPATPPTCQADHEAERSRLDDIHRTQPRPLGQVGMTSIFPPTATAASVAASHSRNQMNCGRPVSPLSLSPSPDPVRIRRRMPRTPDNRRNQAMA